MKNKVKAPKVKGGFMKKVSARLTKTKLWAKAKSPELLIAGGIVVGVGACVMACKQTLKVEGIVDEAKRSLDKINDAVENKRDYVDPEDGEQKEYTKEIADLDKRSVYIKTITKLVKNYAVPAALGAISICMILGGFKIIKKRNMALAATVNGLTATLNEYRNRVKKAVGVEKEEDIWAGRDSSNVVGKGTYVDENGNTVEKDIVQNTDGVIGSDPYIFIYNKDTAPSTWDGNYTYDNMFIHQVERDMQIQLTTHNAILLSDVVKKLGLKLSKEQKKRMNPLNEGWTYDRNKEYTGGFEIKILEYCPEDGTFVLEIRPQKDLTDCYWDVYKA